MNLLELKSNNQKQLLSFENIFLDIINLYDKKKLPNKILFSGPKGTGKATLAYQHYGMGISKKVIEHLNRYLLKEIKINFTFLNIVNEKNLKKRLFKGKRLNRYDKFKHTFYKKVQKGFIRQAKLKSTKYLIVNSNMKIEDNKKIIISKINKLLNI